MPSPVSSDSRITADGAAPLRIPDVALASYHPPATAVTCRAGAADFVCTASFRDAGVSPAACPPAARLAVVLLDGHSQKAVWSSAIQLASDVPVAEEARGQLSQQLAVQLLGSLPSE
jgi:hypothetical protein